VVLVAVNKLLSPVAVAGLVGILRLAGLVEMVALWTVRQAPVVAGAVVRVER